MPPVNHPIKHRRRKTPTRVWEIAHSRRPAAGEFCTRDYGRGVLRRRERTPYVEIEYRDGQRARLPIIYLKDVDFAGPDEEGALGGDSARIAWRATATGTPRIYRLTQEIFAVRLVNPQPNAMSSASHWKQRTKNGVCPHSRRSHWNEPTTHTSEQADACADHEPTKRDARTRVDIHRLRRQKN